MVLPLISVLLKFPFLLTKFLKVEAYYFYFGFIYEITALKLNQWSFPGNQYIGMITLFNVTFPIEELVFAIILASIGFLSYYEFFDEKPKS